MTPLKAKLIYGYYKSYQGFWVTGKGHWGTFWSDRNVLCPERDEGYIAYAFFSSF